MELDFGGSGSVGLGWCCEPGFDDLHSGFGVDDFSYAVPGIQKGECVSLFLEVPPGREVKETVGLLHHHEEDGLVQFEVVCVYGVAAVSGRVVKPEAVTGSVVVAEAKEDPEDAFMWCAGVDLPKLPRSTS